MKNVNSEGFSFSGFHIERTSIGRNASYRQVCGTAFFPPNFVVFGFQSCGRIQCFDIENSRNFETEDDFPVGGLNHLIRMSSSSFLCSGGRKLIAYRIQAVRDGNSDRYHLKKICNMNVGHSVCNLLKLNFFCVFVISPRNQMFVIDIDAQVILKKINKDYVDIETVSLLSKLDSRFLWYSINDDVGDEEKMEDDDGCVVKLLNWEKSDVMEFYMNDFSEVYCMESVVLDPVFVPDSNIERCELLLTGGLDGFVYVYRTFQQMGRLKKKQISSIYKIKMKYDDINCISVKDGILAVGMGSGKKLIDSNVQCVFFIPSVEESQDLYFSHFMLSDAEVNKSGVTCINFINKTSEHYLVLTGGYGEISVTKFHYSGNFRPLLDFMSEMLKSKQSKHLIVIHLNSEPIILFRSSLYGSFRKGVLDLKEVRDLENFNLGVDFATIMSLIFENVYVNLNESLFFDYFVFLKTLELRFPLLVLLIKIFECDTMDFKFCYLLLKKSIMQYESKNEIMKSILSENGWKNYIAQFKMLDIRSLSKVFCSSLTMTLFFKMDHILFETHLDLEENFHLFSIDNGVIVSLSQFYKQLDLASKSLDSFSEDICKNHEDFYGIKLKSKGCYNSRLKRSLRNTSNVILQSNDNVSFPAHIEVLTRESSFFRQLFYFRGTEVEVYLETGRIRIDCNSAVLDIFLNFVYSGEVMDVAFSIILDCYVANKVMLGETQFQEALLEETLEKIQYQGQGEKTRKKNIMEMFIKDGYCAYGYKEEIAIDFSEEIQKVADISISQIISWIEESKERKYPRIQDFLAKDKEID